MELNCNTSGRRSSHDGSAFDSSNKSSTFTEDARSTPAYSSAASQPDCPVDFIAEAAKLELLQRKHRLPPSKGSDESINQLRYGFLTDYRRLFILVLVINLAAIITSACLHGTRNFFTFIDGATAAGANLFVAALMRHEHFVNLIFCLATRVPQTAPLCVRKHAAKVYSYGGVHSGCGVSAFLWFIFSTILLLLEFDGTKLETSFAYVTAVVTLFSLTVMIAAAHPSIRRHYHNAFEVLHRFAGWTAVAMVWTQTFIVVNASSRSSGKQYGFVLVQQPTLWFLTLITFFLIYPWLRVRKVSVLAEQLSSHAVRLRFEHRNISFGMATRLTTSPLTETHGFATIPNRADEKKGFSVVVSNAGDWTKSIIDNPSERIWTKGAPTLGVIRVARLFKRVVIVTTGSGIGPCLSFLHTHHEYPKRVLWSARTPETTYGPVIINEVLRSDPQAVIIDTKRTAQPDLLHLSFAIYKEIDAEAVIIISNPRVTHTVCYGLESRGIPAFGAIFDS